MKIHELFTICPKMKTVDFSKDHVQKPCIWGSLIRTGAGPRKAQTEAEGSLGDKGGKTNKDEDQENSITPWADGPANI